MEVELEPRVKPLGFKVKAMSRESSTQKASNVLDTDLRNHWSTGTNTKEWILLELDEPCLLSHIRIYNKSVLEWDISSGLQYKPETFIKVRPRCEAPRRDMMYTMNYTPCRYVRLSCLRGNPIAIFFIQLLGISVPGLEPEFLPVVNHLLPDIIAHKQDGPGVHLQLLQDMTSRLVTFLPHLELDLNTFSEAPESTLRFLAMLVGPIHPIIQRVNERCTNNISYLEASKAGQASSSLMVSSNFEPRRSRTSPSIIPTSSYFVFRPDVVFTFLRRAYKDSNLGKVCRMASRILLKLTEPITEKEMSTPDSVSKTLSNPVFSDYSVLFGEEFRVTDDQWDLKFLNILDIASVEEGIFHIFYACASQPLLCSKLADVSSDFWSALPLVHTLLPALRPNISSLDHVDDNFYQWKQPYVQQALSQVVATSSSPVYRPLLRACSGYLSSFSPSHAKAASVLIDLCSGVLAPWIPQVVAKVDLALELLEDLLGIIQATQHSLSHARAALKCIVLALSGHIDDMMSKFKNGKLRILFLLEMLEPYLDPVMTPMKSTIAFGKLSSTLLENQEHNCDIALNVIRTALNKSAVLSAIEAEWRRGSVAPSVLLAILEPHLQLPPDIDLRKFPAPESQSSTITVPIPFPQNGKPLLKSQGLDIIDGNTVFTDIAKVDISEDASLLFAPPELCRMSLTCVAGSIDSKSSEGKHSSSSYSQSQIPAAFDGVDTMESLNLKSDYVQLLNYQECELRASEFRRLALDLQSHNQITPEGQEATVESLLLAAECYVNPYFPLSFKSPERVASQKITEEASRNYKLSDIREVLHDSGKGVEIVSDLERKRDKIVLEILLEAAELDKKYHKLSLNGGVPISYNEGNDQVTVLSEQDISSADAITLVRQNQSLLCNFLVQRLQKAEQLMHEILIQSLLFYLNSATRLFCSPECIVDIILNSAEYLNGLLRSFYYQSKEGRLRLDQSKLLKVQRHWMLLQKLVIASTEYSERPNFLISVRSGPRITNLLPPSAWLQRVPVFSTSTSPLVRFLGWMAVSHNAKQYLNERLFLVSDLTQLTYLLSIFSDDLVLVENIIEQKDKSVDAQGTGLEWDANTEKESQLPDRYYAEQSLHAIYPDISHMFPNLKEDFKAFGETILEAVGLQLRSIPSTDVPEMLCWFSDLCKWPFAQGRTDQVFSEERSAHFKGFASKNAKAVILYILEAIVTEHIEVVVPEVPRMVQVILSLCSSKYCDVSFIDAVLRLLNPVISYSLRKASDQENMSIDDSCHTFESLCFDELLLHIKDSGENQSSSISRQHNRALTIFVLASVFPELSVKYKNEILKSSTHWAKFASIEPTTFLHDYLCTYQVLLDNCKEFLIHNLRIHGAIPVTMSVEPNLDIGVANDDKSIAKPWFLGDILSSTELLKELQNKNLDISLVDEKVHHNLTAEETSTFCRHLETLISQLYPTVEQCCNLHPKISKTLARTIAECFVYLKYLSMTVEKVTVDSQTEKECLHALENAVSGTEVITDFLDRIPDHLRFSLEEFAETILLVQENRCWEVASLMLDCLLEVSRWFCLGTVIGKLCVAMKNFSCSAPNISWRLRTDDWMSILFTTGLHSLDGSEVPLIGLFCALLGHPEPELQFIALKHMTNLLGKNMDGGLAYFSSELLNGVASVDISVSVSKQILFTLVSKTWDQVTLLASASTSWRLRIHGIAVLIKSIPFTERQKLQSFLASSDSVLQYLARHPQLAGEGQSSKFALALVASACLYSPAEDIDLIPDNVWTSIATLGEPRKGKGLVGQEQKICEALCRLKNEGEVAKQNLEEVLSSSSSEQCPNFGSMRESILQVLSHLSSTQSYFEFFSKETDQKAMEFEEAETEVELLRRELAIPEPSNEVKASPNVENRLQQIKDEIRSLEKAKLREEIMERRQKKLGLGRARKKYLEEAAIREAELLKELDSEKTAEMEKEIERQRLLEAERAKTRELRYNLDIEKEKQTQRELQRELEQVESGLRAPRRDFSSSNNNRVRDSRYRERENGRAVNEGNLRTSSSNSVQPENLPGNTSITMPKIVLSGGARQFTGPPTILQSHDRSDECGSSYEENFDGSRDSGDTGSVGDPEMGSSLDGQSGYGSGQRHGSRGSKSRPVVERREREARREGKWERKH